MSWPTVKLGDCVQPVKNWNPLRAGDTDTFSYIDIASVDQIRKKILDVKLLECKNAPSRARQLVATDDVLVSTVRPNLNAVAIVQPSLHQATASTGFCVIRANPSLLDSAYLFNWVQTSVFIGDMVNKATGASYPAVTDKIIFDSEIPLPPIAEQKRIAAILDKANEIRRKREQTIAKLDQLAQSIFVEMFGDVATNKGWEVQNLSAVTTFENGDRSSNYPSGDDIKSSGILFLSTKNIVNDKLDLSTTSFITEEKFNSLSRGKVKQNDLIITLRGTLGSCCIFDSEHKTAFINAQMMIIRPQESVLAPYLHAFLTATRCKQHLQNIGNGAAVPQLTSKQFSVLALPVPPLALQEQFANRINKLEQQKADQVTALAKQTQLFASLQHQAFTGNL